MYQQVMPLESAQIQCSVTQPQVQEPPDCELLPFRLLQESLSRQPPRQLALALQPPLVPPLELEQEPLVPLAH